MKKHTLNFEIALCFGAIICSFLFTAIRLFPEAAVVYQAPHSISKEYIWYCMPHENHTQPLPTEKAKFISEYPVVYVGSPEEKVIYLTFDDGTDNDKMVKILDVLLKHRIHAAFFLNEEFIRKNPKTIRRMALEGHLVCNHTDKHICISTVKDYTRFQEELSGVEEAYFEATGLQLHKFFRPPRGRFSELTLKFAEKMGYTTVFWSYSYVDWQGGKEPSKAKAIENILEQTHNGEIILLHTQSATNGVILDELLTKWTDMGFHFKTLDEITSDKEK